MLVGISGAHAVRRHSSSPRHRSSRIRLSVGDAADGAKYRTLQTHTAERRARASQRARLPARQRSEFLGAPGTGAPMRHRRMLRRRSATGVMRVSDVCSRNYSGVVIRPSSRKRLAPFIASAPQEANDASDSADRSPEYSVAFPFSIRIMDGSPRIRRWAAAFAMKGVWDWLT